MKIIPAIDLLNGKCVRLYKGDFEKSEVFHDDPLQMALNLEEAGFKYLHLVDLDGARNSGNNRLVLDKIAHETKLKIDFGGGLKNLRDLEEAFAQGANQVNLGTMAVKNTGEFEKCLKSYRDRIVWNADLRDGKLATDGWQQTTKVDLKELIKRFTHIGLKNILTTDITRDGTLTGPNFLLYKELIREFPQINWIASGGITTADDVKMLKADGLFGAVIGKAMYKGLITFEALLEIQNAD